MTDQENLISFAFADLDNHEEIVSLFKRALHIVQEPSIPAKKAAITAVYDFLQSSKGEINSILIEALMTNFAKTFLKLLSDSTEKVRELSLKSLNFLLSRTEGFGSHLPYIISVLVERMNCHDLEGIENVPEVMRPSPTQRPYVHTKLNETVEEIRIEYTELLNTIISCSSQEEIIDLLTDLVNILRALSMDPCTEVQIRACRNISFLCKTFRALLLHFTEMMARAILLPLVSKKSKVRIAALEALGQILYCGVYKHNTTVMEILIGFRDPNVVPLRDFFEYSTRINYFAILIKDPKTVVREFFIRCLGDWLIELPDRFDHEPRLVPYILSGTLDPDAEIQQTAIEIIEEIGLQQEREKEKDFRDIKQTGYDAEWTLFGKIKEVKLPPPFKKRPRLGARHFVRSHIRKFLGALYREVKDWQYTNRLEAATLLLHALIYTEDYITQFLNKFIINLLFNFKIRGKDEVPIFDKLSQIFFYLGVYCNPEAYASYVKSALMGEIADADDMPTFALHGINNLIRGCFEVCNKEVGISHKKKFIYDTVDWLVDEKILNSIDNETAPIVQDQKILEAILEGMLNKAPADDLEDFYKNRKYQIELIAYTVIGFNLNTFSQSASKMNFEDSHIEELQKSFEKNKIVPYLEQFNVLFQDLMLDNFIEEFARDMKTNYLNLIQWKIVYGLFMSCLNAREKNPEYYHDILVKTLLVIRQTDLAKYSKAQEILQVNVLVPKLIADSFSDEELTKTHPEFLVGSLDLINKIYHSAEQNVSKIEELKDKLLILAKQIFCRNISWVDAISFYETKKEILSGFLTNVSDLVRVLLTRVKKVENTQKEYKNRIVTFNTILNHLGPLIIKKPNLLKGSDGNFLVPELVDYLMFAHEKFVSIDEEGILQVLFEALFGILLVLSTQTDEYKGDEAIIPDYNHFLDRIIILTIDTKDVVIKEKYKAVLKSLCKKTPFNILREWEKAINSKSISRIELLTSLKNHIGSA